MNTNSEITLHVTKVATVIIFRFSWQTAVLRCQQIFHRFYLNPFPDVAGYIRHETFLLWRHFLQWLHAGGRGGGGWVHPKSADSMAVSGLRFENALIGSEWATAVLQCTKGLRKQSSCPTRRPFPTGKHLSQSGRAVAGWVPWLLPAH